MLFSCHSQDIGKVLQLAGQYMITDFYLSNSPKYLEPFSIEEGSKNYNLRVMLTVTLIQ